MFLHVKVILTPLKNTQRILKTNCATRFFSFASGIAIQNETFFRREENRDLDQKTFEIMKTQCNDEQ